MMLGEDVVADLDELCACDWFGEVFVASCFEALFAIAFECVRGDGVTGVLMPSWRSCLVAL